MTGELAKALVAFQAEMPHVPKSQKANVGQYSYDYADLADLTAIAMPILTSHGLAFIGLPRQTPAGNYEVVGTLLHTSGEEKTGSLPISGGTPQQLGSAITYMRRYLFGLMTGIVTDKDDDGSLASQSEARKPAKKAAAKKATPTHDPGSGRPTVLPEEPMQDDTRKAMFALFGELEKADPRLADPDFQRQGIAHIIGRQIESRGELNEGEARQVVDKLRQRKRDMERASA